MISSAYSIVRDNRAFEYERREAEKINTTLTRFVDDLDADPGNPEIAARANAYMGSIEPYMTKILAGFEVDARRKNADPRIVRILARYDQLRAHGIL